MKFREGQEVLIVGGDFKGYYGNVDEYVLERYMVEATKDDITYVRVACTEDELEEFQSEETEEEDEGFIDIPVYDFGISSETLQRHLEYMIGRCLVHVGKVGPEQAFFGFQEFEGKTASEVLLELMGKLEEGMAMFTQAHILIGRVVAALEIVHDQD